MIKLIEMLVDGLRIDTAKHVQKSFWPAFIKAAGVFATGEVLSDKPDYTCNYQRYLDSVINYPVYVACFNSPVKTYADVHMQLLSNDPRLFLNYRKHA
jgi:hypothetical protein